jgi:hypothetical protein
MEPQRGNPSRPWSLPCRFRHGSDWRWVKEKRDRVSTTGREFASSRSVGQCLARRPGCWHGAPSLIRPSWPTSCPMRRAAPRCVPWPKWPALAGVSKPPSRKAKARRGWTNMRSATGIVGIAISLYRSWPTRFWRRFDSRWGKKPPDPEIAELSVPEVRRLLEIALPLPPRSPELRLAWSQWRRARRQQARRSHYRRRGASWPQDGIHRNRSP